MAEILGNIVAFDVTEPQFVDGQASEPLSFLELTDRAEVTTAFAEVDLNDPVDYHYGYKAPWVLRFLPISRGLSDRVGQIEHLSFGAILSDTSRYFRALLAGATTRFLTNRPLAQWLVDDEDRRVQAPARLAAAGFVQNYSPRPGLQFEIQGSDWLKKKFTRKRAAQQSWQRTIPAADFSSVEGSPVPAETVGLPVPIIYGDVNDNVIGDVLDTPTGLVGTVIGAAGTTTYSAAVTAITVAARARIGNHAKFTHAGETDAVFATVTGAPSLAEMIASGGTRYVQWDWDPVANAGAYRFYGRSPGKTLDLNFVENVDPNQYLDGGGSNAGDIADEESYGHPPPVNNTLVANEGQGAVPVIYVGRREVTDPLDSDPEKYEFLVCAHAVKAITGGYVDGVKLTAAQITAQFLFPGTTEWDDALGPNTYVEYNGHVYTSIFSRTNGLGGALRRGDKILTLDVQGIEDIGDGTGDLITSPVLQRLHFMTNFGAPDTPWQSGAYLAAGDTTFPHLPDLPLVDEASHLAVEVAMQDRIAGGYETAGIIGSGGEFLSFLDVMAWWHVSGGFEQTFNRKGQDSVSIEPIARPATVPPITETLNIIEDTFALTDEVEQAFFNMLPFADTKDYVGRTESGWGTFDEVRSQLSIDLYDQERESPQYELHFGRRTPQGFLTIMDVMARNLARYRHPLRTGRGTLPFSGLDHEPGGVAAITHAEGIGAEGWANRLVRFTRHENAASDGAVPLGFYDLDHLLSQYGEFSPEDTPEWTSASADERTRYGFFSDENESLYTDGEPVKVFS